MSVMFLHGWKKGPDFDFGYECMRRDDGSNVYIVECEICMLMKHCLSTLYK